MRFILQERSLRVAARVAAGCAALWLAAPAARADRCDGPLHTVETSAVQSLSCPQLRGLEESLRVCAAASGAAPSDRVAQARFEVSMAASVRRCACDNAPTAAGLTSNLSGSRTVYALAQLIAGAGQARACATTDAQRHDLDVLDGKIQQLKADKAYCSSADADVERFAKSKPGSCYEARLRHAAAGHAVDCGGAVTADTVRALEASEGQMHCSVAAPSCDATQAAADRLRQSSSEADERQLWNLVATRLTAGAGARATREDRTCANRMITIAVSDSAIADRNDRSEAESILRDPQLRGRFAEALKKALNESGQNKELARMLNDGADVKQVIAKANQLDDEKRRQFFAVAGGLGRSLEAARAFSAFEQNSRGFDIVIAPRPTACHYADFVHVLLAGLQKATPARISNVDRDQARPTTTELLAARKQSCGDKAPGAASGPGCGAVAEVVVEDRGNGRGGGQVRLNFVAPDGRGGALTRETQAIQVHDFKLGCGSESEPSEESAAAQKLVFDLQFAFATNPRESAVVLDRPVRTEVCGLRALPPVEQPAGKYDGNGLQILGQELGDELKAPADGAREALAVWKYSVGELDPKTAGATLRFSSVPYSEGGAKGHKIQADLEFGARPAASFATVVLDGASDCSATAAERDVQAGRMIGNEAGSLLARQAIRAPGAKPEAARPEVAKADAAKADAAKADAAKLQAANPETARTETAKTGTANVEPTKIALAINDPARGGPTHVANVHGDPIPDPPPADVRRGRLRRGILIGDLAVGVAGLVMVGEAGQQDSLLQKFGVGADRERKVGAIMVLSALGGFVLIEAYDRITR